MGVKGLTTFVNQYQHQHQQFFKNDQLHTTELVIDGYGIMSKLYFDRTVDPGNHGGEFQKFYDHCAHFCKNLHGCKIKPYVVFDGAYNMDGKKDETLKERHQQKIDDVWKINNGIDASIMPTMANEVFKKVLRDFRVQFAFCDFEADRDIAVLANAFKCPVLAQDSDFFIMDIEKGYIPFDEFNWSNPSSVYERQNVIKCKRYQMKKFCSNFLVEPCLMPLFASVCGNDYRKPLPLDKFFHATKDRNQREPDERPHPPHTGNTKFCVKVLHHFSFYKTYQECLEEIVKHVPQPERARTRSALSASCDMYKLLKKSPIVKFFIGKETDEVLSRNLLVGVHGVPVSFLRSLRQGEVPIICLVIYLNRKYFFGTQVEKISEMRSSYCSQDLLRVLAGIMLVDAAQESKSKGEALTINIYNRNNRQVRCFKVEPLCEIPLFGTVPSFRRISNTLKHQRRLLLLACLEAKDINLNGIPEQFQLVLVVTVYWLRHAQQEVKRNLLVALVLSWIQGVAWCLRKDTLNKNPKKIYHWPNHESVLKNFCYLAKKPLQKSLNLDVSHSLAQWLACICSAEDINALLMLEFPRADMTVFFNGLLIHNLYYALPKDEELIDQLLPRNSDGRNLYELLMQFLSSNYKVEKQPERESLWQDVTSSTRRGRRGRGGSNRNPRGGNI